jgi:hypothetical protein
LAAASKSETDILVQLAIPGAQTAIGLAETAIDRQDDGVIVIAGRRYLKPERLAQILGKSTRTLARWDEQRIGPPKIKIGNQPLYDEENRARTTASTPAAPP